MKAAALRYRANPEEGRRCRLQERYEPDMFMSADMFFIGADVLFISADVFFISDCLLVPVHRG